MTSQLSNDQPVAMPNEKFLKDNSHLNMKLSINNYHSDMPANCITNSHLNYGAL